MTSNKNNFKPDKIIAIFLLFVLATSSLFIHFFVQFESVGWQSFLSQGLFFFGFFGYAVVIGIILFYYLARANDWLKKKPIRIVLTLGILLGLGYSLFDALSAGSVLIFIRDICMVGLILIGLPFIEEILPNLWAPKNKKKK